nr:hypothetical protein [Verrucomicrobiae bacterium]
ISLPNGVKKPKAKKEDEDDKEEKPKPKKLEVTVGQSGPLLLVGNAIPVIEKILGKLGGGTVPVLADLPAFEANQRVIFRDATGFAWANARPFVDILTKQLAAQTPPGKQPAGMTPSPSKITAAAGISGLQTLAVAFKQGDDGAFGQFFLGVPEASRRGLFKLLIPEAKDSAPPAFVSGDVTKFTRYRLDGQKTWATLEAMLAEISPQISALVQTSLNMIGKEKDPNYNFKKRLIGNLGDDVVLVQRPPRGEGLEALQNAPGLTLLGSPDAEQLAQAIKAAAALSPTGGDGLKEREFLGKKIYSLPLPPSPESKFAERYFNFAASGGYVAMSGDAATLEEYLRNHEDAAKPLRATPGLDDAAQRVGGMNTGWFGYENQSESLRRMLELAKNSPELFDKLVQKPGAKNPDDEDDDDEDKAPAKPWLDYKLLPPFEKISKYFNYSIYAGVASADGFSIKWFAPVPPQLKK